MIELIIKDYPKSIVAETIKTIRTNLKFSSVNKKINTILITSSIPGEGKSFISSNLALSYTNPYEKILLIDCDLRKGRQQEIFNIKNNNLGLSNLIIDEEWRKNINKYIVSNLYENLSILPSGTIPPNPSLLLESQKLESIIEELKKEYTTIILDTPPVIGLADTLILNRLADITLIVAKPKKTTLEQLEITKKSLEKVGANIAGIILNRVDIKNKKYYKDNYYQTK